MHDLLPVLLVIVGGFIGIFGATLFFEAMKKKPAMDNRDRKSNIVGSIFLLTVAGLLFFGGVSTWLSLNTTKNDIKNNEQLLQQAVIHDAAAKTNQEITQEQPQQSPEQMQSEQNMRKQEAEKAVKSFAQIQKNFNSVLTSCQSEINGISNGTIDSSYHDLGKLSQQALDLFRTVQDMDVAEQYIYNKENMTTAVLYLLGSIDNLKIYIEDKKAGKFTEAQDCLQKAIEANKLVTIGVEKQAIIDKNPPQEKESK